MALGTPGFSNIDGGGGGGGGTAVPVNFSQTKGAQVTITAAQAKPATVVSATITTQGNPVQIIVSGDANPSAAGWGRINIYRGVTAVGQVVQFESSAGNENVPYSLEVVDEPAAGTWTYSLAVTSVTTDTQFGESAGPIITLVELGGVGSATPTGAAGGDLGGTYPNPDVVALQGNPVSSAAPSPGEVLGWDGSQWAPTVGGGGAAGGANEVQYNDGANALTASANFTYDGSTLNVVGVGPIITAAEDITGQFLSINSTTWSIELNDPLTPTNTTTISPSDVAVSDSNQSANLSFGTVSVTDTSSTNTLALKIIGGTPVISSSDGVGAPAPLNLSIDELQLNGDAGSSGYVLTSNGAGLAPTWQAGGGAGFGSRVHLVVEGGSYSTLQAAVTAASPNDTIIVGPTGSVISPASWGDVVIPGSKRLSIIGLGGANNTNVNIGAVTFSPTSPGDSAQITQNEIFMKDLFINKVGGFTGSQGVLFSGNRPARLRLQGCYIYNAGSTGDGIVVNNSGAGSSLFMDNCSVLAAAANNAGIMIDHRQGYTYLRNYNNIAGGKYALSASAGIVEIYNSSIEVSGSNEVIRVGASTLVTVGYSTIKNTVTNGSGVNLTTAGAVFGMGDATFAIATGTGYCVNGVAGSIFLYGTNTYSNSAAGAYNVKVKSAITSLPTTTTFTSSP